ncbi:hypothetical protein [Daejeonella rubra]|nr:hypothetical protein [Daejeonella rubra]
MELTVISAQFVTSARMVGGKLSFTLAVHKVWSTNIITLVVDLFPRQASVPLLESEQCPVQ